MIPNYTRYGKGNILVEKIINGQIKIDNLVNYGEEFSGNYEQLYFEKFYNYLGSTSRYLMNNLLSEKPYDGDVST